MSLHPTKYTIQVGHSTLPNTLSRYVTPPTEYYLAYHSSMLIHLTK